MDIISKKRHAITLRHLTALFMCCVMALPTQARSSARELFEDTRTLVYQIRVIDLGSGDKFSIGSGFAVAGDGRIATNFHVVSSYVHEPEKYRLEAVAHDNSVAALELLAIDVVHDLAIVTISQELPRYLSLAPRELSKGDRIYSMGNPLDLGMTIIEGTYNGLVENSRYRNILFSGSLNAGMSGGPALNADGEVMGINVAKGAEQISFLVPVRHLVPLVKKSATAGPRDDYSADIAEVLLADQQAFYEQVLANMDSRKRLGDLEVVDKLQDSLRCWGHSLDKEDIRFEAAHQHCKSEDQTFIANELTTGDFGYDFEFIYTEELNRFQFYNLLEERYTHRDLHNATDMEQVTPFTCQDDRLTLRSGDWKISSCLRRYRDYEGLYDASMVMVSQDHPDKAAVVQVSAAGISRGNALALLQGFAEAVSWKL